MQDLLEFSQRIESSLKVEEKQNQSFQLELDRQHEERTERLATFEKKAGILIDTVIRPRMEKFTGYFENASISSPDSKSSHCISRFETRPRFPASTTLGFSVSHDADIENITIVHTLEILPVFMKYDRRDSISFTLSAVNESQCEKWVEQKLMSFLDVYLQLGHIEQYQKKNLVIDPVCSVQVNKAYAIAEGTLPSQTHFFCSEDCRTKFASTGEK